MPRKLAELSFVDWPTIKIPIELEHWKDTSWHKDTCGSLELKVKTPRHPHSGMLLWIDHKVKRQRNMENRFCLQWYSDLNERHCEPTSVLYEGDDFELLLRIINARVKKA